MSSQSTGSDTPDMNASLAGLQSQWSEARRKAAVQTPDTRRGSSEPIPDGKYNAMVEDLKLTQTRKSKLPMLTWILLLMDDTERGRREYYNKVITAQSLEYVLKDLQMCGIDVENIGNLAAYLPQARSCELEIRIKSENEHRNVYFNRRLDRSSSGDAEAIEEIEHVTDGKDFPID